MPSRSKTTPALNHDDHNQPPFVCLSFPGLMKIWPGKRLRPQLSEVPNQAGELSKLEETPSLVASSSIELKQVFFPFSRYDPALTFLASSMRHVPSWVGLLTPKSKDPCSPRTVSERPQTVFFSSFADTTQLCLPLRNIFTATSNSLPFAFPETGSLSQQSHSDLK